LAGTLENQRVGVAGEFNLLTLAEVGERNQDIVPGIELQDPVGHRRLL
jgi:hypothetical protein